MKQIFFELPQQGRDNIAYKTAWQKFEYPSRQKKMSEQILSQGISAHVCPLSRREKRGKTRQKRKGRTLIMLCPSNCLRQSVKEVKGAFTQAVHSWNLDIFFIGIGKCAQEQGFFKLLTAKYNDPFNSFSAIDGIFCHLRCNASMPFMEISCFQCYT